jgi:hypothetical protein
VLGLGDTLFGEVSRLARELDRSFTGKDGLSQRALSTFRRIREKLGCLAFVDCRVQPVLDSLEDWLARVPTTGSVTGALFNEGFGLMLLVCDPQRMSDHGAGILALQELIPSLAETLDEGEDKDDDREWSFGGPLGDEAPDEAPAAWDPGEGRPQEQASFYF